MAAVKAGEYPHGLTAAALAKAGGKWKVTFTHTLDEAIDTVKKTPKLEDGFAANERAHLDELSAKECQTIHDAIAERKAKLPADESEARDKLWELLQARMNPAKAKAAAAAETAEVETTTDDGESSGAAEGDPQSEDSQSEGADVATTKKAKAKAKKGAAPAAKAAKAAKAKKDAAPKGKGLTPAKGITPAWLPVFAAIEKAGDAGISVADMTEVCAKHNLGAYYRRFVVAGFLKAVGRGQFAITAAGKTAMKEAKAA